jgi:hypothetical protein
MMYRLDALMQVNGRGARPCPSLIERKARSYGHVQSLAQSDAAAAGNAWAG